MRVCACVHGCEGMCERLCVWYKVFSQAVGGRGILSITPFEMAQNVPYPSSFPIILDLGRYLYGICLGCANFQLVRT